MKIFTLILLIVAPLFVFCQKPKVLIEPSEYEGWVIANIEKYDDSWDIVSSNEKSNVIFKFTISKALVRATGKLEIINSKSNEVLYTSPSVNGNNIVTSGYSPVNDAIKKLIKDLKKNFDKSKINLTEFGDNKNGEKDEDKYDKLIKLKRLLDEGVINKEEFDIEKKKILNDE
jgi:hypothetical protein